ncbi:MAG: hypothetical protein ABH864_06100 [archaeon]
MTIPKNTKIILGVFAVLLAMPFVVADSYELWCLVDGQSVDFGQICAPGRPIITAPDPGFVSICVHLLDSGAICHAPLGICNGLGLSCANSTAGGNVSIDVTPPELEIFTPADGELFTSRNVLIDLTSSEVVDIHYQKAADQGRWISVCSDCTSYSRERSFDEGLNEVTFRAVDRAHNEAYYTIFFNIDSQDPRLRPLQPDDGFASGAFHIEFDEDNPDELILHYGNYDVGFREYSLNVETECTPTSGDTICEVTVDLTDYDGQQIEVYATITDLAGNMDETTHNELDVDNTLPIINSADFTVEGKKVNFVIDITEPYFKEVTYIDNLESNPREKRLCSSLVNDVCEKRVNFNQDGDHEVVVTVKDEAGNEATHTFSFFTDSKSPKIRNTEPSNGFASGLFEIEFEEENPAEAFLFYGSELYGFRNTYIDFSSECYVSGDEYFCSKNVDLADYDGQEIEYKFQVYDEAGQMAEEGKDNLAVDISFPVINMIDYNIDGKNVYFSIDIDEPFLDEVTYIDNLDPRPREKKLCSKLVNGMCEKKASFRIDGDHDVTITVRDESGHVSAQNVLFFTDSKDPKISDVTPTNRDFASGLFEAVFNEENPISLVLEYGNSDIGYITSELSLENDCNQDDDEYYCWKDADLSYYEGQDINYKFTVTDRAGQKDMDGESGLRVDITFPTIDEINYEIQSGNRAEVTITATEENLDKITYFNSDDARPRLKTFCSRFSSGGVCEKRISLNPGINRIDFMILDEAGNVAGQQITINN